MPIIVDFNDVYGSIASIERAFTDLTPFMNRWIDELLIPDIENIFSSNGLGTWLPTTRSNPILRDELRLYKSVTDRNSPEFLIEVDGNRMIIDTEESSVFYHDWHEEGPDVYENVRFPARPVIGLLDDDDPRIDELLEDYVRELVDEILRQFGFPA